MYACIYTFSPIYPLKQRLKVVLLECSNDSEILRTLRFGERMKSVRNDPVVNEITEDDVNDLSDQIRQLKVQNSVEFILDFVLMAGAWI